MLRFNKIEDFFKKVRKLLKNGYKEILLKLLTQSEATIPIGDWMFKVNNRNTRARCDICSMLIIKTPERRHWPRSVFFIINFEHISHLVLLFLL